MSCRSTPSRYRFAAAAVAVLLLSGIAAAQAPSTAAPAGSQGAPKPVLEDIRDIRGPRPIASPWVLAILVAAGVLIGGGAYGAWRWRQRQR